MDITKPHKIKHLENKTYYLKGRWELWMITEEGRSIITIKPVRPHSYVNLPNIKIIPVWRNYQC